MMTTSRERIDLYDNDILALKTIRDNRKYIYNNERIVPRINSLIDILTETRNLEIEYDHEVQRV